jgi:serine/threonine protein kinase
LHGDLYAHNILFNAAGESLLGDFGAASFYPDGIATSGQSLESLEVRAFGCLLEDLLEHCPMEETQPQTDLRAQLHGLQHDCLNPIPSMRPPFAQINTLLTSLA